MLSQYLKDYNFYNVLDNVINIDIMVYGGIYMYSYYNTIDFERAGSLIVIDPLEAKFAFEEYIQKYPTDYFAYLKYIYVLIILNDFESAEKMVNYVERNVHSNLKYLKCGDKVKKVEWGLQLNKIRVLFALEKYKEVYDYINQFCGNLDIERKDELLLYCQKKLNKIDMKRNNKKYIVRQIIDYQEDDFFAHIMKHQLKTTEDNDMVNNYIFSEFFPVQKIVQEVKKYIPSSKKMCTTLVSDTYVFKLDDCGRDNNRIVDFFKVVCFHNTADFITMFPAYGCDRLPYVDLNYMDLNKKKNKVKTLSQIEKFNRRYRR